ncbi:MAG: SusC/RagA family TonB-linked outer membrane protein [Chitinophagaceae bacterium]
MSKKRSVSLRGGSTVLGIGLLSFSALLMHADARAEGHSVNAPEGYFQQPPSSLYIGGTVRDKLGSPISGVTVRVVGADSTTGVATDDMGKFSIKADPKGVLEFSHINYKTQTYPINSVIDLEVTLDAKEGNMNEVVVVGYGRQKRLNLVSAQSSVNVEDLKTPVANISAMLAGRIPGLVGVQRSGEPGRDGADLWIRGIATFGPNNAGPIIYIDGVPNRSLGMLEPEDIESITTLKDAAAVAVYGVEGANGVILIKTKGGKTGKPSLNARYDQGITRFTMIPKLADGITYMKLVNEARTASGQPELFSQEYIDRTASGEDPYLYPNVDWMDALFNETGKNRRLNLNARGGAANANYYVSLTYYDETGLLKTNSLEDYNADTRFKRYNFTSNLNLNVTKTTRFELGFQGYISNSNYPGDNTGTNRASSAAFGQAMQITPVAFPVMYPGNIVPGISSQGDQRNPYADITQRGFTNEFRSQLYSNIRVNQDLAFITPGLSFTSMFAFDTYSIQQLARLKRRDTYYRDPSNPRNPDGTLNLNRTYSGNNTLGFANAVNGNKMFYTESAINYSRDFGAHSITGLLLYNQRDRTESIVPGDLASSIPYRNRGLATRVTYGYDSKYFLELNMGYNGNENFDPNNRYGFFPSFGVGWVASNEKFFESVLDYVQFLKIRYSDGITGSSPTTRFGYLSFVTTDQGITDGYGFGGGGSNAWTNGLGINQYGSPISWSEGRKTNLGLEFKVLNNRLSFIFDAFKERRTGVLLNRGSVAGFVGLITAPLGNLGEIENKGIDGTIEAMGINIGNTKLTLRGNFSFNRDKMIYDDVPEQKYPWLNRDGNNVLSRFGLVAIGLFKDEDDIAKSPTQTFGTPRPGDIKYKDLNEDGVINADDRTYGIGRGDVPAITYGFGTSLVWKNFYIDLFLQGIGQVDRMLGGDAVIPFNNSVGAERSNLFAAAVDRWTPEDPREDAMYPRLGWGAQNNNNAQGSSWWVKDMSFLRLKTAEIGYNLPKKAFSSIGVKSSRVYLQGVNLLTISKFDLWDPELNTNNGTVYPNITAISMGIQANF